LLNIVTAMLNLEILRGRSGCFHSVEPLIR
jgi:hypothetical protein